MEEMEGVFAVELDELLDPKTSQKTGKPYYQISVRRKGQGVGDMFVNEEIYNRLKAVGAKAGQQLAVVYRMVKLGGTMETRLDRVELI